MEEHGFVFWVGTACRLEEFGRQKNTMIPMQPCFMVEPRTMDSPFGDGGLGLRAMCCSNFQSSLKCAAALVV